MFGNIEWLMDIAHTDSNAKSIDMTNYRGLILRLRYNGFTTHQIYPSGLLTDTNTKVLNIEPDRGYYCIARLTTAFVSGKNISVKLNSVVRHSDTVSATINVYGLK